MLTQTGITPPTSSYSNISPADLHYFDTHPLLFGLDLITSPTARQLYQRGYECLAARVDDCKKFWVAANCGVHTFKVVFTCDCPVGCANCSRTWAHKNYLRYSALSSFIGQFTYGEMEVPCAADLTGAILTEMNRLVGVLSSRSRRIGRQSLSMAHAVTYNFTTGRLILRFIHSGNREPTSAIRAAFPMSMVRTSLNAGTSFLPILETMLEPQLPNSPIERARLIIMFRKVKRLRCGGRLIANLQSFPQGTVENRLAENSAHPSHQTPQKGFNCPVCHRPAIFLSDRLPISKVNEPLERVKLHPRR